jgi:polar amino acid transport system permease protein
MEKTKEPTGLGNNLQLHKPSAPFGEDFDNWWLLVAAVIGLIVFLALTIPDPYRRIVTFVSDGLLVTVAVTLITFVLVLVVGLIGGLGRISHNIVIRTVASLYVEMVRGVPLLVQLLFWYFAFPSLVQRLGRALNIQALQNYLADPVAMAILGLTFCYGAYMSEVYRAGIQSITKGQMEAARSLGMNYFQAMRHVILPQAVRVILPPVGNEFISLLKDSSLVSVVAVPDITLRGRQFMATSMLAIETWVMVGLMYLSLTLFSARLVNWIERKSRMER